jgi:salicylate biosynthesis isochorismate synthase/menaquinone-specific isochorismate synthase
VESRTAPAAATADRGYSAQRLGSAPEIETQPCARPLTISGVARTSLAAVISAALARAGRRGVPTLASLTVPLRDDLDPSAVVLCSRRRGEPWFLLEQPRREGMALAALGEAVCLEADGGDRFEQVATRWRALAAGAVSRGEGVEETGPVAVGGFAFDAAGARSPAWSGFAPASLVVPEVAVARDGGPPRLTLTVLVEPGGSADRLLARIDGRLAELRAGSLPPFEPAPGGHHVVSSAMPAGHFEAAVASAGELIADSRIEKIVLAREVQVHAPQPYEPGAVFGVLREAFASCFVLCVGRGDATLISASPELLVRREGQRVSTLALAGSRRRSADPAVDAHLGEQLLRSESYREEHAIVVRGIERALRPHAVWVTAPREPTLARIANIQHLATPIRAQLAAPMDAIELTALLHPTPAIGGEPAATAMELIPTLESLDRGWYAGPVGWTDATGDGEFCVALRCALLRGRVAHCYAGNGIVKDSDPATELAETEVKLSALLPLLAG